MKETTPTRRGFLYALAGTGPLGLTLNSGSGLSRKCATNLNPEHFLPPENRIPVDFELHNISEQPPIIGAIQSVHPSIGSRSFAVRSYKIPYSPISLSFLSLISDKSIQRGSVEDVLADMYERFAQEFNEGIPNWFNISKYQDDGTGYNEWGFSVRRADASGTTVSDTTTQIRDLLQVQFYDDAIFAASAYGPPDISSTARTISGTQGERYLRHLSKT